MLSFKKFCFGNMFSNTYLVWDEESREAIVVDCGNSAEPILREALERGLSVKLVVLTHGHYDHILYMDEFRECFPEAKLVCGEGDEKLLCDSEANVSYLFGDTRTFSAPDALLNDKDVITLGESRICVLPTPGHTPGGICLYSKHDALMFTGDTLFAGGIGRTDFKYGSFSVLRESLQRLLNMDGEIEFHAGHGGPSKIAYEQRSLFY
ncbi:MAG: MBL fold metallo-hydrolase [Clostridia bacterium]|nr:MBL fold metallo-hydrolase [Clostridia bacterium]